MDRIKACASYFRKERAFDRFFLLMRKKWESYGRTAGQIMLKDASPQEQVALEGVLGRPLYGGDIRVRLSEFEGALGETRFGAIALKDLLEEYFGEPVETNKTRQQRQSQRKNDFLERMQRELEQKGTKAQKWIGAMREQKGYGYQLLMAEYDRSPEQAEVLLRQAGGCMEFLEKRKENDEPPIYLALLASQMTGNPHALDRGNTAGQLLTHGFCYLSCCRFPDSAQKLSELFWEYGVQMDEVSSTVTAYGIHLQTADGLHPAYEGYMKMEEPCVIMLSNLTGVSKAYGRWTEDAEHKPVFIVENEMVFSHLQQELTGVEYSLLCTSGQPRTAAFVLLDLLAASGAQFYYAGDLDPEGMMIAERLWRRYGEQLCIWHMGIKDYEKSVSGETIGDVRLGMLDKLMHPVLVETAKAVRQIGMAGYQEQLVEELRADVLKFR